MRSFFTGILFTLVTAGAVQAAPVTFNFTGTATNQAGVFSSGPSTVTGSVTFDTGLVDSLPGDGFQDFFNSTAPENTAFTFAMSVTNGAVTRSVSVTNAADTFLQQIDGFAPPGQDRWVLNIEDSIAEAQIELLDSLSPLALYGPGDGTLTDTPVGPSSLNLSQLTASSAAFFGLDGLIEFDITSFSPASTGVPGPPALPLLGAGLLAVGVMRRRVKGQVA